MKETYLTNVIKRTTKRIKEGLLTDIWKQTIWLYRYAKHYWKSILLYTILGLIGTAIGLVMSLVSKDLIDIITGYDTGRVVQSFCLFIGLSIANILITQVSNYASNIISIKVDNSIKADIFEKMLVTEWESITAYHTGDLLTRWSSDASVISNGILNWIPNLIIYIVKFISSLAVVIYYDPSFAVFALLGLPVSIIMSRSMLHRMKDNNKRSAAMNAKMAGFNQETFSNIQTLKAFDLLHIYTVRLKQLQHDYLHMRMDFQKMSMITSIIMAVVGILVSYSCYGWGIYRVWSGAISYGTMTMFLSLSGTLTSTLNSLISLVPTAISITTSASRLMDILDMPKEDFSNSAEIDDFYQRNHANGISIQIDQLDYTYHNGTQVFSNVSLEAHPHEIIGLVGPSGEGKTTMLRILLSLLHIEKGECHLYAGDSKEEVSFTPATRRLFSYVPQGNTMFSGTIAENLRCVKPDASDDEIIHALELACAWGFVSKLPKKLYSPIGERGGGFSEGQAQRLAIARALLRKSPILLLDEATSALDVATERQVIKSIMQDTYPRTCIVTSHRPTVLNLCNRVYKIDNKQVTILNDEQIKEMMDEF